MRHGRSSLSSFALAALSFTALTGAIVACGASKRDTGFTPTDGGFEGATGFVEGQTPCAGLECKRVQCEDGKTTTLTGKVYDPAKSAPLYNVIVYIPGGNEVDPELPPFKDSTAEGVSCEPCSGLVLNPLVSTLTNEKGEFTLENVPLDKDVPIVIQIGKWRRKFHIDITKKCTENKVKDKEFSLPSKSDEGDMPHIAVTTGGADALECLLRGIGIDESEFVLGHNDGGHVHIFNGAGFGSSGTYTGAPNAEDELWNDAEQLKKYDLTLMSCEGGENLENKGGGTVGARGAIPEYLDSGGRVFATHYHYVWFKESPVEGFRNLGTFNDNLGDIDDGLHDVDMSFAKGEAFGNWLENVGSSPLGEIDLSDIRDSVSQVNEPATVWIKSKQGTPRYFTVNTPLDAEPENQCGRAVFSDLHITGSSGPAKITACSISSGGLNEQQRALEFFLFDLSACISDDKTIPSPPK